MSTSQRRYRTDSMDTCAELERLRGERDRLAQSLVELNEAKKNLSSRITALEEELAVSGQARLRAQAALNLIPVVLVETTLTGQVSFVSSYWSVMMGTDDDTQSHGSGFMGFIHDEDRANVMSRWAAFMKSGETYGSFGIFRQWKCNRKELLYIEGRGILARNPDGSPYGYLCTLNDVTALKLAELELARKNAIIEDALVKAEAAAVAKASFIANVSHEIRTPLHGMLGFLVLLEDSPLNEEQQAIVKAIRECSEGLHALVSDVLDLSKIEAGKQEVSEASFDLREWLQALFYVWSLKAAQKNISMTMIIDGVEEGPPFSFDAAEVATKPFTHSRLCTLPTKIVSDDAKLRQVAGNLLSNSIKFTESGGSISLRIDVEPMHVVNGNDVSNGSSDDSNSKSHILRVSVKDSGCGIEPGADADVRVFHPFTQLDGGIARKYGGTGLGLAISKSLIEMFGGKIEFESEGLGKGSRFWFWLPVGGVQEEAASPPGSATEIKSKASSSLKDHHGLAQEYPMRILVAEDNLLNQKLVVRLLQKLGYSEADVTIANNGAEALQAIMDVNLEIAKGNDPVAMSDSVETAKESPPRPYKLILMDLQMPVLDGIGGTERIRELPLEGSLRPKILAMTANVLADDRTKCEEAGMDGYLSKPLRIADLVDALKRYGGH